MPAGSIDADVAERLETIRREHGEMISIGRIAEIVTDLLDRLKLKQDLRLYTELEQLADYIRDIKAEIAALRPDEIQEHYLPSAADELDAIVEATENATNSILAAAEAIESVAADVDPAIADRLTEVTTSIYEACTFQDITGQRIGKVVKALKVIQGRVETLVNAFGSEIDQIRQKTDAEKAAAGPTAPSEKDLLNGPQLSGAAKSQDDIDALFSGGN
ncbi:MAG: protein phosphatase CheZ [Alphaproteobacteria bacterium]